MLVPLDTDDDVDELDINEEPFDKELLTFFVIFLFSFN